MRKALSVFVIFFVALLLGKLPPIFLFAQDLVWETEGVILSDPTIRNVEVIPLPAGGSEQYRMFFDQGDRIKSALSTDGRSFTLEEGVRLQGTAPALVKLPDAPPAGGQVGWRMFFQSQENGKGVLKSALSNDAFNWTAEEGVRLASGGEFDPDNVAHPSVISLPEGGYRMYYDGELRKTEQEFTWRILSASSPDGLNWTKDVGVRININEAPLDADRVWSSHAEYYPLTKTYQLYFSASRKIAAENGIYLATSTNGLLFTVSPKPELAPMEEIGEPFGLNFSGTKRMYYWVSGSGIYSAVLREPSANGKPGLNLENLWEKIRTLPQKINLQLPENPELYIVPAVLLAIGLGAVIYLWRSRLRR